jgi:luciferase family oxidoreductase group 1
MVALSVLDLCFVTTQTPPRQALTHSIELASHVDRLGYKRFWLAEHHSLPSVASSAPEIMIGQVAAATKTIRVGSGGIMLTNHAPLMVAERFKMLEALFPGRIDLGLGRAPGTDQVTAYALRRHMDERKGDDFLERLQELILWETREFPPNHPFHNVFAMPSDVHLPPLWLLGSSGYSAELSAMMGTGYAFAHHFSDYDGVSALLSYRQKFKPSDWRTTPYAIACVAAVIAKSDEEADRLASSWDLNWLRRRRGEMLPYPSPEEAMSYPYSDQERHLIAAHRARLFVGSPHTVKQKLEAFIGATQADEIMVTSPIFDHQARLNSYALLAKAWHLSATAQGLAEAL